MSNLSGNASGAGMLGGYAQQQSLIAAQQQGLASAYQQHYLQHQAANAQASQQLQKHAVVKQLVGAAAQAWMAREASYMFTDAELAEKIWDMAEKLADEGMKRGHY